MAVEVDEEKYDTHTIDELTYFNTLLTYLVCMLTHTSFNSAVKSRS